MPTTIAIGLAATLLAATSILAAEPRTGTWGDQGDGTYRNPILNGDYPDVDIEQAGEAYYMITSTNHYAPGMTLLESRDLVNWRIIGHVFDKLTWEPKYNWDRMDGYRLGVWAGDLARHGGKWYCYFIDASSGLYASAADRITGPWTKPVCMLAKRHWTDPAVFWDDETKRAYLVCNFGRDPSAKTRGNQTRLFRMSWDGLKLLDEGKAIYQGPGAEAAKIYKVDGRWYIFMAEWRSNDRKQIVLRSKTDSLYGPFERRVVMEKGSVVRRSVCQGALVRAADGSWWYTHQLVQTRAKRKGDLAGPTTGESFEGRSQWLVPVRWQDGWPVLGKDADGNGVGNTVRQARKPIAGHPVTAPQTDDDFDSRTLSPQWQWNHNPRDDRWSLTARPGWLRLTASVPVGEGGFWNACNTISQRLMGRGRGTATARVDLRGMAPGQEAGLNRHSGQYHLLSVVAGADGSRRLKFDANGKVTLGPAVEGDVITLRTVNDGPEAHFAYSLDGKRFTRFGSTFTIRFGRWRGDRIGLHCWNSREPAGHIDIDWFTYDYDGPKPAK